jgi:hypothetical protein
MFNWFSNKIVEHDLNVIKGMKQNIEKYNMPAFGHSVPADQVSKKYRQIHEKMIAYRDPYFTGWKLDQ